MALEYIVYSNGETATKVLNAIATFFTHDTFGSMVQIAMMFGAVGTLIHYSVSRDPKAIFKWALVYTVVPLCLINMTTDMQVVDKTEPHYVSSVQNVPYVVALPTWLSSTLMSGITESVENIFSSTQDERYGRTGMLYGSRLYLLSRQSNLRDVRLKRRWHDFFRNCIVGDIQINRKYTWDDLFGSPDILAFLDSKAMSPLRAVFVVQADGSRLYQTCEETYPSLKSSIEARGVRDVSLLTAYLYGDKAAANSGLVQTGLENSYATFLRISKTPQQIMTQNMTMNALRNSINDLDPTASALNYAYTSNKMQTTSMWANIGLQAREFVPMLHTVLFLLFSALSIFVIAAALLPSMTVMVLTNYAKTFFHLAVWPSLFAIINAISIWGLESVSGGYAGEFHGLTLSNDSAIDEMHTRFGMLAGYLLMSVPFLAGKILQGSSAALSGIHYQLAGMINSTNARTSEAVATGDLSMANMQIANRSWNNTSANKLDTQTVHRQFGTTMQRPDGSEITHFEGGSQPVYNTNPTVSQLHWGTSGSHGYAASVRNEYQTSQQAVQGATSSLNSSVTENTGFVDNWHRTQQHGQSYGTNDQVQTSAQVTQGVSAMTAATEQVSSMTGWSHDDARSFLTSVGAGMSAGGGFGAGTESTGLFGRLSGNVTANMSRESRESYNKLTSEQQTALFNTTQQFNEGANLINSAANNAENRDLHQDTRNYLTGFNASWQSSEQSATNLHTAMNRSQVLSQALSRVDNDEVRLTENLMPAFQRYIQGAVETPNEAERIITGQDAQVASERQMLFDDYVQSQSFIRDLNALPTHVEAQPMPTTPAGMRDFLQAQGVEGLSRHHNTGEAMNEIFGTDDIFDRDKFDGVTIEMLRRQADAATAMQPPKPPVSDSPLPEIVEDKLSPLLGKGGNLSDVARSYYDGRPRNTQTPK